MYSKEEKEIQNWLTEKLENPIVGVNVDLYDQEYEESEEYILSDEPTKVITEKASLNIAVYPYQYPYNVDTLEIAEFVSNTLAEELEQKLGQLFLDDLSKEAIRYHGKKYKPYRESLTFEGTKVGDNVFTLECKIETKVSQ